MEACLRSRPSAQCRFSWSFMIIFIRLSSRLMPRTIAQAMNGRLLFSRRVDLSTATLLLPDVRSYLAGPFCSPRYPRSARANPPGSNRSGRTLSSSIRMTWISPNALIFSGSARKSHPQISHTAGLCSLETLSSTSPQTSHRYRLTDI